MRVQAHAAAEQEQSQWNCYMPYEPLLVIGLDAFSRVQGAHQLRPASSASSALQGGVATRPLRHYSSEWARSHQRMCRQ